MSFLVGLPMVRAASPAPHAREQLMKSNTKTVNVICYNQLLLYPFRYVVDEMLSTAVSSLILTPVCCPV